MNQQQLQMLQYLQQQNSVNLTPQQQVNVTYINFSRENLRPLLAILALLACYRYHETESVSFPFH
jgi:hypothetical protein